jgi:hypothetical protein
MFPICPPEEEEYLFRPDFNFGCADTLYCDHDAVAPEDTVTICTHRVQRPDDSMIDSTQGITPPDQSAGTAACPGYPAPMTPTASPNDSESAGSDETYICVDQPFWRNPTNTSFNGLKRRAATVLRTVPTLLTSLRSVRALAKRPDTGFTTGSGRGSMIRLINMRRKSSNWTVRGPIKEVERSRANSSRHGSSAYMYAATSLDHPISFA